MLEEQLRAAALEYHEFPQPGKISIVPTRRSPTSATFRFAYSPGVAYACTAIQQDPALAAKYTARANLVAVITTAARCSASATSARSRASGDGGQGVPLQEVRRNRRLRHRDRRVGSGQDHRGGRRARADVRRINLEDIKAPECFYIERKLRERMKIPVFHDDQHGTAIVAAAAVLNGLKIVGKDIGKVKLVCSGAGAAALACLDLQVSLGPRPEETSSSSTARGSSITGRKDTMDPDKARYAQDTAARTLADVIGGADIFLGLSAGGVLTAPMVKSMADQPIILAMANPEPEIRPRLAKEVRPDCLIGTGRSDYPNQVNNLALLSVHLRGALDAAPRRSTRR